MIALAAALLLASSQPAAASGPVQVSAHVEADGSHTLVHEVIVEAPAADIWAAISTAQGWTSWAVPVAWTPAAEPDVIEASYAPAAAPGDATTIRQQIVLRVPGRLLAYRTVKAPDGFPHFDTYRRVASLFELEPLGPRRTRVRLTGTGYADDEAGRQLLGFFRDGNRVSLEWLRRRFTEGPRDWTGAPDMARN